MKKETLITCVENTALFLLIICVCGFFYLLGNAHGVNQERDSWYKWCLEHEWAHLEDGEIILHDKTWINNFFEKNHPKIYDFFKNDEENEKKMENGV
jgi:hypothetical protein